jgi:hypothetical protein
MTKQRGNPLWGKANQPGALVVPTLFETRLKEWGLTIEQAKSSKRVKEFIRVHRGNRYIPESILEAHGCDPNEA